MYEIQKINCAATLTKKTAKNSLKILQKLERTRQQHYEKRFRVVNNNQQKWRKK